MKKNLFITAIFTTLIAALSYSQCSVDPQYTSSGIWPDPVTGIASGVFGYPYVQNFTIVVPADTTEPISGLTGIINYAEITGVAGLPSGLTAVCNPLSCSFPGDTKGCMEFTGTPLAIGTFTVTLTYIVNFTISGFPPADSPPQDYVYSLVIADSAGFVGISTEVPLNITQLEILPNPSSEVAQIKYTSSESQGVHLTMYNLIGEKLLDRETESSFGSNSIDLNVSEFKSGIYFVTLSTDNGTVSKKLVVGGR